AGAVEGELLALAFRGPGCIGSLRLADGTVVEIDLAEGHAMPGDRLRLRLDPRDLVAFDD
ncbi:MAG TPA: TOBE domain-containing protein, partial [Luteimonas sp.]